MTKDLKKLSLSWSNKQPRVSHSPKKNCPWEEALLVEISPYQINMKEVRVRRACGRGMVCPFFVGMRLFHPASQESIEMICLYFIWYIYIFFSNEIKIAFMCKKELRLLVQLKVNLRRDKKSVILKHYATLKKSI